MSEIKLMSSPFTPHMDFCPLSVMSSTESSSVAMACFETPVAGLSM